MYKTQKCGSQVSDCVAISNIKEPIYFFSFLHKKQILVYKRKKQMTYVTIVLKRKGRGVSPITQVLALLPFLPSKDPVKLNYCSYMQDYEPGFRKAIVLPKRGLPANPPILCHTSTT